MDKIPYCDACDQPCQVVKVDFGIGPYEYAGAPGCQVNFQEVSKCCEGPVVMREPVEEAEDASDLRW